jgi:hypothetical protein
MDVKGVCMIVLAFFIMKSFWWFSGGTISKKKNPGFQLEKRKSGPLCFFVVAFS